MTGIAVPELCRGLVQVGLVLLLQSSLVLGLGLALGWAVRRRGPQAQSLAYRATLLAVAVTALIPMALAHRSLSVWRLSLPTANSSQSMPAPVTPPDDVPWSEQLPVALPAPPPVSAGTPPITLSHASSSVRRRPTQPAAPAPIDVLTVVYMSSVGAWGMGTFTLLTWLIVGQCHLALLRRRSRPISGDTAETLADLCAGRHLSCPRLLSSSQVRSPFLAGLWRPAIFLPAGYETEFSPDALRAVLAHELAHWERRDNCWALPVRLLTALLWPQPLLWLLVRRMEFVAEEACDTLALAQGGDPRAYADCLLTLAERLTPTRLERSVGLGVIPFRSQLGRRIQQILCSPTRLPALSVRVRAFIACGALAAVIAAPLLVSAADSPSAAQDVVREYLADLAANRPADAYRLLSPATQNLIPLFEFHGRRLLYQDDKPPPDPHDPQALLSATYSLLTDASNDARYRFELIGSAPDGAVLVRASPPGTADKDGLTLRLLTVADPKAGNAPRLDIVQTLRPLQPDVAERLEARKEQMECLLHLKQIGLAIMQYVVDHKERFPHADHWVDEIMPYAKDPSIFHDPAAPAGQRYNYAFNRNLSGVALARIKNPQLTVAVFESTQGMKNASDTGQSLPRPGRHQGGSQYAFTDGHAQYYRAQTPSFSLTGGQPVADAADGAGVVGRLGVVLADGTPIRAGHGRANRVLSVVSRGQNLAISGETPTDYAVLMIDKSMGYIAKSAVQLLNYKIDANPSVTNTLGQQMVQDAQTYLGVPYVRGGSTKDGIDDAALIRAVYAKIGIDLPRRAGDQATVGYDVPHNVAAGDWTQWAPGDRMYFACHHPRIDHTAMYIGNGLFIHAPMGHNQQVAIDRVDNAYYSAHLVAVRRSQELLHEQPMPGDGRMASAPSLDAEATKPAFSLAAAVKQPPPATRRLASEDRARFLAGLTPVQGPGVIVTLRDSRKLLPGGSRFPIPGAPNLIHDTDINEVVNELKAAGAEAITVNDQRLVATSFIRCAGPNIYVNNLPVTPPYIVKAIGDSKTLQTFINLPNGVADQLRHIDPAMISIQQVRSLELPAYVGANQPRYARPLSQGQPTAQALSAKPSQIDTLLARRAVLMAQLRSLKAAQQTRTDTLVKAMAPPSRIPTLAPSKRPDNVVRLQAESDSLRYQLRQRRAAKGARTLADRNVEKALRDSIRLKQRALEQTFVQEKMNYVRAVHEHNLAIAHAWSAVARDRQLTLFSLQIRERQAAIAVLDREIQRLRAGSR